MTAAPPASPDAPDAPAVPVTHGTLEVPGARLHHEVRGAGPLVALVAAPMGADAFAPLADLLAADHTVLTTDPRGIGRSTVEDPDADITPEVRADDVARLVAHVDAGPAVVVGSSGGAVTVLALAQLGPDHVPAVIAHEPPLLQLLPDREHRLAETDRMVELYRSGDVRAAFELFAQNSDLPPQAADWMEQQLADPQGAADTDVQFRRVLRPTTAFVPDLDLLRSGPTRVVVGVGQTSGGQICDRTSRALAEGLGTGPVLFPGGHIGFAEDPAAFADRLRAVLLSNGGQR